MLLRNLFIEALGQDVVNSNHCARKTRSMGSPTRPGDAATRHFVAVGTAALCLFEP